MKYGIGQPVRRKEDIRLVTGKGQYTDDLSLPGEAHAAFVRSPHAHARILNVDVSAALAMPGIVSVLTARDIGETGVMPVRGALKNRDGSDQHLSPKTPLPADKVRYPGEVVAVVLAETAAQAQDAAEQVMVDYEPLAAVPSIAAAPSGPSVWEHAPGNLVFDWVAGEESAVAKAFAGAARVVSADVVQNRLVPAPMEPRGALGAFDAATGRYTLHTGTQGATGMRDRLAQVLNVPAMRIRVLTSDVGGGFGMKTAVIPELALVLLAAKASGRPVKWTAARSESFLGDSHGRDVLMQGEMALDDAARILAIRVNSRANLGSYMTHAGANVPTAGLRVLGGVYRVPAVFVAVKGYFTNTAPVSAYRGAGRPEAVYLTERLMDAAASAFGLDPVEIRRRNLLRQDELPYKNWRGLSIDSGDFVVNLEETARRADWDGFVSRRAEAEARGKRLGHGIAYYMEASGGPPGPEPVRIRFTDAGVEVELATQANGQGHETTYAQIVADALGVAFERVTVKQGDSDNGLSGGGTVGSRSMQTAGSALDIALKKIVAKGRTAAAHMLQAGGAEMEFAPDSGMFRVAHTERSIAIADLAAALKRDALPGFENGLDEAADFEGPPTFPNGCHACELEIDPETGTVEIQRYTIVDDLGRLINPLLVDGQIHGGLAQGIGQVLMENCIYDEVSGQLVTASFLDYAMPRAADIPHLDISYNEVPCVTNPLGVKGAGEAGTIGALPAIVAALSDALGIAHIDMPATPEKIWRILRAA